MYQDFKDLLSAFHAQGVKYLIVGGYAVSFHAQPRATKDLDLFISGDQANAEAAYKALVIFGAPMNNVTPAELSDPRVFFRFGREPIAIDILPSIDGVDFESAWQRRIEAVIDADTGLKASFISKEDLVAAKLAAGRLRDLADVEDIRSLEKTDEPE